jgi:hypothetical protein
VPTFAFNGADLIAPQAWPFQIAAELRIWIVRQRRSRGTPRLKRLRRLAQPRIEPADAEPGEDGVDAVDNPPLVADQALPLAARSPGVFLRQGRDRDHAARALLATPPTEQ